MQNNRSNKNKQAKNKIPQFKNYDSVLDPDQLEAGRVENRNVYEENYTSNES